MASSVAFAAHSCVDWLKEEEAPGNGQRKKVGGGRGGDFTDKKRCDACGSLSDPPSQKERKGGTWEKLKRKGGGGRSP